MSLEDCLRKAGKALNKSDSDAIVGYVSQGMSEEDAVQARLRDVETELDALLRAANEQGGQAFGSGIWTDAPDEILEQKRRRPNVTIGGHRGFRDAKGFLTIYGDPQAIRELLPEGVKGRVTRDGLVFTPNHSHRVTAALKGEKATYSRAGKVTRQRKGKDGKYVGAPPAGNTPAKLREWRKTLKQLASEGAPGRFWYENSGTAILEMTGGDIAEAKKFIALLAIYSSQAKVDSNSTFALRAWAQYKAGLPISVKTRRQDRDATEVLYEGKPWRGEKTNNFYINLLREVDPSHGEQGVTVDMWMMRAGQYDHDAPTPSEYAFMENETNRLARELGWEPQQVQAAIWVAMKARMENKQVIKDTQASSQKRGWIRFDQRTDKDGKTKRVRVVLDKAAHLSNWIRHGLAHQLTPADTNRAKFDFSDGVRRHLSQMSWEARPGVSSGILPGIHGATYEQQMEFQRAVMEALVDENGVDLLAQYLGILADGSIIAPGSWEGAVSPSTQGQLLAAPIAGLKRGHVGIDPAQAALLDTYASVMGILLRQDGMAYHRPFYGQSAVQSNGIEMRLGRSLTPAEAKAVTDDFVPRLQALGLTQEQINAIGLVSSAEGMRVINFGDKLTNKEVHKLAIDTFAAVLPAGVTVEPIYFRSEGALITNDWKANRYGESFEATISAAGRSDVLGWSADNLAPRVQRVFEAFSQKYGWGDPGQIPLGQEARVGIAEALRELAQFEDAFRFPQSNQTDFPDILQELLPVYQFDVQDWSDTPNARHEKFLIQGENGEIAFLFEHEGRVWLDLSSFVSGLSNGNAVIMAAGLYAHRNGLKFVPDPSGHSPAAVQRAAEIIPSLILRTGSASWLEPAPEQLNPDSKWPGLLTPMAWAYGNDDQILADLLRVAYDNLVKYNPEVALLRYENGRVTRNGAPVSDSELQRMAEQANARAAAATDAIGDPDLSPPVWGSTSIKRGALASTLLSGLARKEWRLVLAGEGGNLPDQVRQVLFQDPTRNALGLYSAAEAAALNMNLPGWKNNGEATGREILQKIVKEPRVKAEELQWLGLAEYLSTKPKFTRAEVVAYIRGNGVRVEEITASQAAMNQYNQDYREWQARRDAALPAGRQAAQQQAGSTSLNPAVPPTFSFEDEAGELVWDEMRPMTAGERLDYGMSHVPDDQPLYIQSGYLGTPNNWPMSVVGSNETGWQVVSENSGDLMRDRQGVDLDNIGSANEAQVQARAALMDYYHDDAKPTEGDFDSYVPGGPGWDSVPLAIRQIANDRADRFLDLNDQHATEVWLVDDDWYLVAADQIIAGPVPENEITDLYLRARFPGDFAQAQQRPQPPALPAPQPAGNTFEYRLSDPVEADETVAEMMEGEPGEVMVWTISYDTPQGAGQYMDIVGNDDVGYTPLDDVAGNPLGEDLHSTLEDAVRGAIWIIRDERGHNLVPAGTLPAPQPQLPAPRLRDTWGLPVELDHFGGYEEFPVELREHLDFMDPDEDTARVVVIRDQEADLDAMVIVSEDGQATVYLDGDFAEEYADVRHALDYVRLHKRWMDSDADLELTWQEYLDANVAEIGNMQQPAQLPAPQVGPHPMEDLTPEQWQEMRERVFNWQDVDLTPEQIFALFADTEEGMDGGPITAYQSAWVYADSRYTVAGNDGMGWFVFLGDDLVTDQEYESFEEAMEAAYEDFSDPEIYDLDQQRNQPQQRIPMSPAEIPRLQWVDEHWEGNAQNQDDIFAEFWMDTDRFDPENGMGLDQMPPLEYHRTEDDNEVGIIGHPDVGYGIWIANEFEQGGFPTLDEAKVYAERLIAEMAAGPEYVGPEDGHTLPGVWAHEPVQIEDDDQRDFLETLFGDLDGVILYRYTIPLEHPYSLEIIGNEELGYAPMNHIDGGELSAPGTWVDAVRRVQQFEEEVSSPEDGGIYADIASMGLRLTTNRTTHQRPPSAALPAPATFNEPPPVPPSRVKWSGRVNMHVPHENYREIKLMWPDSPEEFRKDLHFPDPNIIIFMRTTDRENGTEFHIDELQSDWHQAGRQEGYKTPEAMKAWEDFAGSILGEAQAKIDAVYDALKDELQAILPPGHTKGTILEQMDMAIRGDMSRVADTHRPLLAKVRTLIRDKMSPMQQFEYIQARQTASHSMSQFLSGIVQKPTVPDAPFKGDINVELAMKRAIIIAAQEGKATFSWANSDTVIARWGERSAKLYRNQYDQRAVSIVRKLTGLKPELVNYDGTPHTPGQQGKWVIPMTPELVQQALGEGFSLFQPLDGSGVTRGMIDITDPTDRIITLGEASDLSTFLHESAHLFLEMEKELARRFGVTELQREMLEWLGAGSFEEITVEQHELWARTFEAYLREGKAPSLKLRGAFARFRGWLLRIYQDLLSIGRIKLDDEARSIFDRMLATEEEIALAQADPAHAEMFDTEGGKPAGMSDADWQKYQENAQKKKDKAADKVNRKLIDVLTDRLKKEWKEDRKVIEDRIRPELEKEPVYQVMKELQETRLDMEAVKQALGVDKLDIRQIGKLKVVKEGGVDPALVSDLYGYKDNVKKMLMEVLAAQSLKKEVEARAEAEMRATRPDPLTDGTLQLLVAEALQNEHTEKQLIQEIGSLSKKEPDINRDLLKAEAERVIRAMKHKDIKPARYYHAMVMAAQKAATAAAPAEKRKFKIQQLANHYLYREAVEAKARIERQIRYVRRAQKAKYNKKQVDPAYIQNIKTLANLYEVRADPADAVADAETLLNWYTAQVNDKNGFVAVDLLDPQLVEALALREEGALASWMPVPITEMTGEQLQGLTDMLKHMRFVGGTQSEDSRKEFEEDKTRLVNSIIMNGGPPRRKKPTLTKREKAGSQIRSFLLALASIRNLVRTLDGNQDTGAAFRQLYQPLQQAEDAKLRRQQELYNKFKEELGGIHRIGLGNRDRRTFRLVSGETIDLSVEERFMMALYWGTESSRTALMDGYGLSEADVMAILATLTPDQLKMVNATWRVNESMWPDLAASSVRLYGVAPPKLPAAPFVVNGVNMTGGHMRLYYDSVELEMASERQTGADWAKVMPTKAGSLHTRIGSGGRKVALDRNNIIMALDESVHFVAYAEVAFRMSGFLNSREVRGTIVKYHGEEFHRQLIEAIDNLTGYRQKQDHGPRVLRSILRAARVAATYKHLAYSIRNTVQQITALPLASREVGHGRYMLYLLKMTGDRVGSHELINRINEASAFMKNRATLVNRETREFMKQVDVDGPAQHAWNVFKAYGFAPQTFVDSLIAYPVWMAKYDAEMADHNDHARAVTAADVAVSESVGSGSDLHLGGMFQQNNPEWVKAMTAFGSWFNAYFNRIYRDTKGGTDWINPDAFSAIVTMPIVVGLLSAIVVGDYPDDDGEDDEGWLEWAFMTYASFLGGTVPVFRDLMGALAGMPVRSNYAGAISAPVNVVNEAQAALEGRQSGLKTASDIGKAVTSFVPLPGAGNIFRMVDYLDSYYQGNEVNEPDTAAGIYQGLVEGKNRN